MRLSNARIALNHSNKVWNAIRYAFACCLIAFTGAVGAEVQPVVVTPAVHQYELGPHIEYIEDPTRRLRFEDVSAPEAASRYRPAAQKPGDINFGFSRSAYWLRFTAASATERDAEWLLEIGHPPLDRVEIYAPDGTGRYALHVTGDAQPFSERAYPHRNLILPIPFPAGERLQTIYLRVTMDGTITLPLKLWEPKHFAQQDEVRFGWLVLYLGMLCALAAYNLMLYATIRERMYLYYVGFVVGMALAQASYAGLGFQYLWPEWPQFAHFSQPLWMALTGILSCSFTREFLNTRAYRNLDRLVVGFMAVLSLSILALALGFYRLSVYIAVFSGLCGGVAMIGIALYCVRKGQPGARHYLLARSLLGIGVTIFCLRMLGWLPSVWITNHAVQIGSALEILLLAFALADRINGMRREKEAAQAHALQIHGAMLKASQIAERELETRIEARTRELEHANAQLRAREQDLQHLVHHDPLTGLASRVLLYSRMRHALTQRRRDGGMLAVLLIDLDNFKPVNDEYGHAVGDELLVAIAIRFKAVVRDNDTVARFGGDEFVVLLEQVNDMASIEPIAEKIRRAAARPFEVNGLQLYIACSVGTAVYPHDGTDVEALLAMADASMYGAKLLQQRQSDLSKL